MSRLLPCYLLLLGLSVNAFDPTRKFVRETAVDFSARGSETTLVATAWYASWHAGDFPLTDVSWSKYTHMTYAFAITTPDLTVALGEPDVQLLPQFVAAAHKNKVKASLSIGGWTGSRWFSSGVGSSGNRTIFVKSVTDVVEKYKLDGVDFDWEYPGLQGVGCNVVNPNDTSNFLAFLQELRATPTGANLTITAATATIPFSDPSGNPSTDLSGFSKVLDYIAIMNYDIKSVSGAGPNAPMDDACAPPGHQKGSAVSAVKAWTSAGIPSHQIVLGVPAYGHSFNITPAAAFEGGSNTTLAAFPPFNANNTPVGDRWDGPPGLDVCGAPIGQGGVFTYWGLIEEDFLNADGSAKDGIAYRFDNCSETPYVYNAETQVLVSFDNPQSFAAKGDFIKTEGLRGFAIWEAGGDYKDALLDAISNAAVNGDPSRPQPASASNSSAPGGAPASSAPPSRLHAFWRVTPEILALGVISIGLCAYL